jgi:hypothetical protein
MKNTSNKKSIIWHNLYEQLTKGKKAKLILLLELIE